MITVFNCELPAHNISSFAHQSSLTKVTRLYHQLRLSSLTLQSSSATLQLRPQAQQGFFIGEKPVELFWQTRTKDWLWIQAETDVTLQRRSGLPKCIFNNLLSNETRSTSSACHSHNSMNICYSWYLAYKAPGVEFLSEHAWLSWRWSGVCLVPEVNSGHRYRWLWWNGEHYWNASHLRLILSPQSVSDRRKDLLTAGCPLPPSVCLFLSHIRIQALQFTPLCGHIHFLDFWCSLSWSSKPQMFGLHSSIEEQQAALLFSLSFFRQSIPLLESVTNSFSQL